MKWIMGISTKIKSQHSLFYTLFGSFAAIILLLVSVHMASFAFFRTSMKNEIIQNSSLNLSATADNYEKHLKLIRSFMLSYLFNNDTQLLKRSEPHFDYDIVREAQVDLQQTLNNANLYLENIIYYFRDSRFVIEKDGTRTADTMFGKFYHQPAYSVDFWNREMDGGESFVIYPSAEFISTTVFGEKSFGRLMPIMVKNSYDHRFAFLVLLKSAENYQAFHQPKPGSSFLILDRNRKVLFASPDAPVDLPELKQLTGNGYEKVDNTYYFYQSSPDSGLTYMQIVSGKGLSRQIQRLNAIMLSILFLSLLIALAVSYLIAKRFHNPLARILRSIHTHSAIGSPILGASRIREFNQLHSTLDDLSRSNHKFHQDLQVKNNLLQQFAYMTRLKMIYGNMDQLPAALDTDKPYRLILFQIDFKSRFYSEISRAPDRAFILYKELIDTYFSGFYADSLTFQSDKDQILTILFAGEGQGTGQRDNLDGLIAMLHTDAVYCNFTIAPSPLLRHSADFADSYQQVLDLIRQRRLGEDIQVITEWQKPPLLMIPSPSEEHELTANLYAGADNVTVTLVERCLDQLNRSGALARQFQDFAKDVVNKTIKIMYAQSISITAGVDGVSPYDQLKGCHTVAQYKEFLRRFLTWSADAIRKKKAETDVTTKFVMEYVEANYGEDLSLDMLAGKLGITGPYLSTYFKEKTGTNFSDYINTVRMNKAIEMLRDTDLKIQEIASLVGYYTVASFNRVFKKYTGVTPSEFRKRNHIWRE